MCSCFSERKRKTVLSVWLLVLESEVGFPGCCCCWCRSRGIGRLGSVTSSECCLDWCCRYCYQPCRDYSEIIAGSFELMEERWSK